MDTRQTETRLERLWGAWKTLCGSLALIAMFIGGMVAIQVYVPAPPPHVVFFGFLTALLGFIFYVIYECRR